MNSALTYMHAQHTCMYVSAEFIQ